MNKSKNKTTVLRSLKLKDLNIPTMLGVNQQTLTRKFNVSTSSQYSLSPNRNSTDNYAQSANGLFYLKVGEDVVYERNEINGGWMVTLLRPIKITRDISWSSTWGGTLTLYIEKDWNMNLTFSTSDGWRTNNQWIYGRMSIETDVMDPDTSMYFYSFENDIKNNKTSITRYTESRDGGIIRGKYYSIKNLNGASKDINISINHNPYSSKINTIFVRDLNGFIRFDGEFAGYYNGFKQINYNGPNDMFIKVFNTIGVRMPYLNIMQSVATNNDFYDINIPNIYAQSNNLLLDISKCLNVEQQTNGAFKITLQRPIRIINNVSTNYRRNERVITTIGSPNNLLWNITTYLQWSWVWDLEQAVDLNILINTTNENDNEYSTSNANAYTNNSIYKKFSDGSEEFDNYIYVKDNGNYQERQSFITNANTNKNVITVRSLDNIIRINASFADYGKVSRFDNSYYYLQGDININANITLVCRESKFQTPSSYYPYKEVDETGDVFYVPVPINDSNNTTYNKVINSKVATFDNMTEVKSYANDNTFFTYYNQPPPNGICYYTYIKHSDQIMKENGNCYYGFDDNGTFVDIFDVKPTKYENEYTLELIRPFNLIFDVSIAGRWGGKFILRVDEYFRTDFAFEFIDGWLFKNQTVCGTWAFRYPSDKFNYSLIFKPNSDELLGIYNMFKISESGVYITSDYFEKNVIAKPPISNGFNKVTNKSKKMLNRKKTMTATKGSKGTMEINVLDLFGEIIGVYSSYHQPDLKVELQHQKFIITVRKILYFTKDRTVDDFIVLQDGKRVDIPNVVNTDISKYFYSTIPLEISYEITPIPNIYFNASLSGNILTIKDKRAGGCNIKATGKFLNEDLISFGKLKWEGRITDDDIPKFTDNVLHLWLTPKSKHPDKKPDIIIDRKPNSIIDGVPTPELVDGPYEWAEVYAELADDLYNNNSIMKVLNKILNSDSSYLNSSNISYLYVTGKTVNGELSTFGTTSIITKQIIKKPGNERKFAFEARSENDINIRNNLASFGGIYPTQPDNTNGEYGWEESGFEYNSYLQNNNFYKTLPIRLYIEKIAVTPRQTYINNNSNPEYTKFNFITSYPINIRKDYSNQDLTGQNLIDQDLTGAIFTNANLTYTNFKGAKLAGANLSNTILSNANLSGANLSGANLSGTKNIKTAILIGATFTSANLSGLDFSGTNLSNINFSSANLSNTNFSNAIFTNTNLSNANLTNANLSGTNITYATFIGATLTGANLSGLDLSERDFSGTNLSNTNFSNAILTNTNLSNANLTNANLSGTNIKAANITGATLTGANLSGLDLSGRDFSGANLSNTNFSNAILTNTNLSNANLSGANLSGTNIKAANITGATLTGANLSGLDLSGRDFSGANLSNANLSGANLSNTNLSNTIFSGANLSNANLSNTNLSNTNFSGANLIGINLSNTNLSERNFSNINFSNANLSNINFSNVIFIGATFTSATLTGTILTGVNFTGATLTNANLTDANLTGARALTDSYNTPSGFINADFTKANFTNANLSGVDFINQNFTDAIFTKANLTNAKLQGAKLTGAIFIEAVLNGTLLTGAAITGANLTNANLTSANLSNANLSNANLTDAKNIKDANVTGTTLTGANLTGLDFSERDFSGLNLSNTNFSGANLTKVNLSNANLSNANLSNANLTNVNLSNANLSNANLSNANLSNAILTNTILTDATLIGINLSNTNLLGRNFSNTNFSGANLTGADFSKTNFTGANLSGTNFTGATLINVKFTNANLTNANLTSSQFLDAETTGANLTGATFFGTFFYTIDFNSIILSNEVTVTGINSDAGQQFTGPDKIDKISIRTGYNSVNTITINGTTYGDEWSGNQSSELQLTETNYINEIAYSFDRTGGFGFCEYLEFKTSNGDIIKAGNMSTFGPSIRRLKNIKLVKISGKSYSGYLSNLTFTFTKL